MKELLFRGNSLDDLRKFPALAMREAGYQLDKVQNCNEPTDEGAAMKIGQRFSSVWDAIENTPQQAASMRARSALMMELESIIKRRDMTQAEAAALFGVTQPRVSDLMRGKINLFSLDCLMDMATAAGLDPQVTIKKPKVPSNRRDDVRTAA